MPRSNGRSGSTPLLHGHAVRPVSPSTALDDDRGRPGYRAPRRLHDDDHDDDDDSDDGHSVLSDDDDHDDGRTRFGATRPLRSRSPAADGRRAARRTYAYSAFFLAVSLVAFTVQTELAAAVQRAGWNKAYCMLYVTHGSWSLLWPVQLLVLRLQKRHEPWPVFWRRHVWLLRTTAAMVETRTLSVTAPLPTEAHRPGRGGRGGAVARLLAVWRGGACAYMLQAVALITCALTVAGLSWYVAVNLTTPSDLTAIYNCSAFFAYAFSVPLLHERLRLDKSLAVLVAVAGVLVVAYGDARAAETAPPADGTTGDGADDGTGRSRLLGNLIIGGGSVLYGLYEVLYKRFACPPDGCSPGRGMVFANTFGSAIGVFTLAVLWVPLPVLHVLGIERFVLPTGRVAWYLGLSVVMNATFAGAFLVLISLTSPVLSSVASLLTIFLVAVVDWVLTGQAPSGAALAGGSMIVVAFVLLSWSTYREMAEAAAKKAVDLDDED